MITFIICHSVYQQQIANAISMWYDWLWRIPESQRYFHLVTFLTMNNVHINVKAVRKDPCWLIHRHTVVIKVCCFCECQREAVYGESLNKKLFQEYFLKFKVEYSKPFLHLTVNDLLKLFCTLYCICLHLFSSISFVIMFVLPCAKGKMFETYFPTYFFKSQWTLSV